MTSLTSLQKIIPPDQALANKALERSLRQTKNIAESDLQVLAPVIEQLESNYDLPLIQALETPIPPVVESFYANTLATGTGPNNTLTVYDVIGTAAGAVHNEELPVVTTILQDLDADGQLDVLTANAGPSSASTGVYTVMQYCLGNTYTVDDGFGEYDVVIPVGVYGAGSYHGNTANAAISNAFSSGLIPVASNLIANIAAANSALAAQANDAFNNSASQLSTETTNRSLAKIDFANLEANVNSVTMSVVTNLHDIGLDTTEGGSATFFENVANLNSLYGQAVISSMREGRNIRRLNDAGIVLDTQLPDTPTTVTEATLLPGQESVAEAAEYAQKNQ
jgi:hypothetical protein